jgi:hypothetical protein
VAVPTDIAGLETWLRADAITGKVDGDPLSQWDDSSGNANHAAQVTGANQPLYKTGILNGLPVVRFDGTDDFMTVAGITNNTATRTLFLVARRVAGAGDKELWSLGSTAAVHPPVQRHPLHVRTLRKW